MKTLIFMSFLVFSFFLACQQYPSSPHYNTNPVNPSDPIDENPVNNPGNTYNEFFDNSSMTFRRVYSDSGPTNAQSVIKTSDGGYALIGTAGNQFYLIKTDACGNARWKKKYGQSGIRHTGMSLRQTPDGGFILIGSEDFDDGLDKVKIVKTDKNGKLRWQRSFDDLLVYYITDIALTHDNGYVGLAYHRSVRGATVFKLNSGGHLLWVKTYSYGEYPTQGRSIEKCSDNGFVITGWTLLGDENEDIFLLKIDADGNEQWQSVWGEKEQDIGNQVIQTSDCGYVVVGKITKEFNYLSYISLSKTDSQGKLLWTQKHLLRDMIAGYSVQQLSDQSFIVLGYYYNETILLKTGSDGTYQWHKSYDQNVLKSGFDLVIASDGGYVISATMNNSSTAFDTRAGLIKTDASGNF